MLTTSVLRPEESVDGLEDGFLFLGQRHDAGEFEAPLGVAEIDFVHGAQFQQRAFRRELRTAQAVPQQGQEQVGQVADENVSMHVLGQPMAHRPQVGDTFQTVEGFFDQVLVEVE